MSRAVYRMLAVDYLRYIDCCVAQGANIDDAHAANEFVLSTASELGEDITPPSNTPPIMWFRGFETSWYFIRFGVALMNVAVAEDRIALADVCARKCVKYLGTTRYAVEALMHMEASLECIAHVLRWAPTEVLDRWEAKSWMHISERMAKGYMLVDEALAQRREWRTSVAENPEQADMLETLL
jgi:hypothetical protein